MGRTKPVTQKVVFCEYSLS